MRKKSKLVCGWGVNDVDYPTQLYENVSGKRVRIYACPYYIDWKSMLGRCFNINYQNAHPNYVDCTVCEEWKYLSNFIKWVDSQPNRDWVNCNLDKDILFKGNRVYAPETCVYVGTKINSFVTDSRKIRGYYMLGVTFSSKLKWSKYQAYCRNPFIEKGIYLGSFSTELEAHIAWQAKKHEHALRLAEEQDDPRVAKALRERYAPDKDWTRA